MKLQIIVCDDEAIALKINCTYIEELAKKYKIDAGVIGFQSGEKIMEYVEHNDADIAFLDIDLKGMNGIEVASKLLRKNPKIITIFITGHREFAYDAFTVEAFSFLTKPIELERLERIFKRAILQVNDIHNRKSRTSLVITEDNLKKKINEANIIYIERNDTQSTIVTKTSKHYVYEAITSLAERISEDFIRVSQGIIVNLSEIALLEGNRVTMKTGEVFPIGRTYSKEVKKRYLSYPQV